MVLIMYDDKKVIPSAVIRRMAKYYRYLCQFEKNGILKISSQSFADTLGITASQVRQDFGYFGGFGHRGYGYVVSDLKLKIQEILTIPNVKKCILIGCGSLGTALLSIDYEKLGFDVIGVFDSNPSLENTVIRGHTVINSVKLSEFCEENEPLVAFICIPTTAVEDTVKVLYNSGIRFFWNFSHYNIMSLFNDVTVENVHLNDSLMTLGFLTK